MNLQKTTTYIYICKNKTKQSCTLKILSASVRINGEVKSLVMKSSLTVMHITHKLFQLPPSVYIWLMKREKFPILQGP